MKNNQTGGKEQMIELIQKMVTKVYNEEALKELDKLLLSGEFVETEEELLQFVEGIKLCLKDTPIMAAHYQIYLRSVLIALETDQEEVKKNMAKCVRITFETSEFSKETKYYLLRQFGRMAFVRGEVWSAEAADFQKKLYEQIYQMYKEELAEVLVPIPKEERNPEMVVVFTTQFLGIRHAPTHSALERCYSLGKLLGKQVLLINTKEVMTALGEIPFLGNTKANLIEEYSYMNTVEYKDYTIEFFQPEVPMPDVNVIRVILEMIREVKPWFVLGLGGQSIVADLCSNLVPEAALSFVFSNLPATVGQMSVLGRQLADGELEHLVKAGYQKEQIIESTFTFELHPQKKKLTKADLGIPEDKFILVTVGTRLDAEISDEFIRRILETVSWGTHYVIVGYMDHYDQLCARHQGLREHSTFLGYQDDVLAVLENCDLYVNPQRAGGGFSIVESFYQGVPGVTVACGDVATAAGKDFWVKDYDELFIMVKQYMEDGKFYQEQVKKAKERVNVLLDGKSAMEDMVAKIENNPLFF